MEKEILNSKGYIVTCDGHVFTRQRQRLKSKIGYRGYEQITIVATDNSKMYCLVHRLVAQAFIPNPENKPFVNHIDGCKTNNHVSNLEWVTPRENSLHAARVLKVGLGENSGHTKLKNSDVHEICQMMVDGKTNKEIADIFLVGRHVVEYIRAKKTWIHISHSYNLPKRKRRLSDSTAKWICAMLKKGYSSTQILSMAKNPKITKHLIQDISSGRIYKDISEIYLFNNQ